MQKCNENCNKFSFSRPFNSNCCVERCYGESWATWEYVFFFFVVARCCLHCWRKYSPSSIWLMFFFHHKARKQKLSTKKIANAIILQNIYSLENIFLQEDQDWGFVAMVLDRLFLWLFTTASLFGTFSILCEAPALWVYSRSFLLFPRRVWGGLLYFKVYFNLFFLFFSNSYDDTRPIDIEYSIIAQKLFNLTVKDH